MYTVSESVWGFTFIRCVYGDQRVLREYLGNERCVNATELEELQYLLKKTSWTSLRYLGRGE